MGADGVWLGTGDHEAERPGEGIQVVPKRWVVERTFGWLGRYRRLSKDYEKFPETSEALIRMAMIHIMVRVSDRRANIA